MVLLLEKKAETSSHTCIRHITLGGVAAREESWDDVPQSHPTKTYRVLPGCGDSLFPLYGGVSILPVHGGVSILLIHEGDFASSFVRTPAGAGGPTGIAVAFATCTARQDYLIV